MIAFHPGGRKKSVANYRALARKIQQKVTSQATFDAD
jgi:hypothetical protein